MALVALVIALAKTWLTLYTSPLPADLRHRRRLEILGDIDDQLADGAGSGLVVRRLVRGAVADVTWSLATSVEHAHPVRAPGGVVVLALPMALLLWLAAETWRLRSGTWAALATASYLTFWAIGLAAALFLCSTLARSLTRRSRR